MENTSLFSECGCEGIFPSFQRLHFIGILGAGMRVAARVAEALGYTVSGSDRMAPDGCSIGGIAVLPPGDPRGIQSADLAVLSLAIPEDDPEVLIAKARGIPLASRADFLGLLMRRYRTRIGVAGTHGKSTVTAMCADLLHDAGHSPTVLVGAPLVGQEDGYLAGGDEMILFEACEYKRSFLSFSPSVAVLLNAEWDHPDCFADRAAVLDAFFRYLSLPSVRMAVVSADDPAALEIAARLSVPVILFGMAESADVRASEVVCTADGSSFWLSIRGEPIGRVTLSVLGEHNVKNALAAYATAYAVGAMPCASALSAFLGLGHRMQYRGSYAGASYYDDYAHHPTEIRAGIATLRGKGQGRLIAVFQPHTYSRTAALFSELSAALALADDVIVTDIYSAREKNESGIAARSIAAAIGSKAIYMPTPECAALAARVRARAGDTVVAMGAGDLSARFFSGALAFR